MDHLGCHLPRIGHEREDKPSKRSRKSFVSKWKQPSVAKLEVKVWQRVVAAGVG
jgi:hypothetical protein